MTEDGEDQRMRHTRCRRGMPAYRILAGKPEVNRSLENLDVGGSIILKWLVEKQDEVVWTGSIWLRIRNSCGQP
jgi:hypothetical protein